MSVVKRCATREGSSGTFPAFVEVLGVGSHVCSNRKPRRSGPFPGTPRSSGFKPSRMCALRADPTWTPRRKGRRFRSANVPDISSRIISRRPSAQDEGLHAALSGGIQGGSLSPRRASQFPNRRSYSWVTKRGPRALSRAPSACCGSSQRRASPPRSAPTPDRSSFVCRGFRNLHFSTAGSSKRPLRSGSRRKAGGGWGSPSCGRCCGWRKVV